MIFAQQNIIEKEGASDVTMTVIYLGSHRLKLEKPNLLWTESEFLSFRLEVFKNCLAWFMSILFMVTKEHVGL